MLVTRPSRSARPRDAAARGPRCRPRSDCTPSAISTTAPASLTTVNTVADVATTAASPAAARMPHASTPIELPAVQTSASRRPPRAAVRTTIAVAGPGVIVTRTATGTKARSVRSTSARRRDGPQLGAANPAGRVVELRERRQLVRRRPGAVERVDPTARDDRVAEALAVLVLAHLHVEAEQPLEQLEQRRAVLAAAVHRGAQLRDVRQDWRAGRVHDVLGVALDQCHRRLQAIDQRLALGAGDRGHEPALAHLVPEALEVVDRRQLQQRRRVDLDLHRLEQLAQHPGEVLA